MYHNVRVNGDDMLFKCNASFYPFFLAAADDAGFKISQGKNYMSRSCALINSQFFRETGPKTCRTVNRVGYLNLRLITGTNIKASEESLATPCQIGKELGKLCALCPWAVCAIPAAFQRWASLWKGRIFQPNWFLPVHLGGFGVPPEYAPSTATITLEQREMAARFVSEPQLALFALRGGLSIPVRDLKGACLSWRWVVGDYVQRSYEGEDLSDAWLQRLAYACRAGGFDPSHSDPMMKVRRFKRQYALKPMSRSGLRTYWRARLFAQTTVPCPSLSPLRVGLWELGSTPGLWE